MDYEKIGNYIAERRKAKKLLQKDLALKLGVTDRAVSKWERGKGLPDVSILEPLANILATSVLEILHGENLEENKKNAVVVQFLKNKEKHTKFWKRVSLFFINFLLVILVIICAVCMLPYVLNLSSFQNMHVVKDDMMSPILNIFDEAFFEEVQSEDIREGDVVFYRLEVEETGNTYERIGKILNVERVKSEINFKIGCEKEDDVYTDYVGAENIEGRYVFKIPYIGVILYGYEAGKVNLMATISFLILGITCIVFIDVIQIKNHKRFTS